METIPIDKKQRSIGSVQFLPVNLFASVMGIAGLSLAWRQANKLFGTSTVIADAIGVVAVVMFIVLSIAYTSKWIQYPQKVAGQFMHPVSGNFFGTISISILLLSPVLGIYSPKIGQAL